METCDKMKRKRKFVEAWLNDDRYKSWIRQASDNTMYHCNICNKSFSCSASHVSRHADSACHKNNIKENIINDNEQQEEKRVGRFRQQWLDIDNFQPWLREVPDNNTLALCIICNKTIAAKISHLYRHAESEMHREKLEKSLEANKWNENINLNTQTDESPLSFDERKKIAEIKYAALITEKNIPHRIAKEILQFFQQVDPNVLKNMSMSPTKCKNIISNVLCPVETERVVNSIQNTKFSIFIDETSDITNEKWMTFLVRYVDSEALEVRTQLVKLIDIDARDCSAEKLFNAFKSEMYKLQIPFTNILALSCDNASVMTGKYLSFKKKLEEKCKHLLTFTCPCHSAALAAHAACAKMPDFCEEFLRKVVNYINSSPKRSAIFKEFCDCFQDTNRKLLKLCDTRWLSHYICVDRILESWETIKYFLNEMVVSEKTKSGENVLSLMNNIDIKAYFLFLRYVLHFFNAFNTFFQAHETRIHLLHSKAVNFLIQITQNFLKP